MIIAITGRAGAGKTTMAAMIEKATGGKVKVRSFKEPLAAMLSSIGLDIDTQEQKKMTTDIVAQEQHRKAGCDTQGRFLTRRGLAQFLATDLIRKQLDNDFFIKRALKGEDNVVFDDLRFYNESQEIIKAGGVIIKIERECLQNYSQHESEDIDVSYDKIFFNNYDLDEMEKFVQKLLIELNF